MSAPEGAVPAEEPQACAGCVKVARALDGLDGGLIAVLPHSVLLLGDHQVYPGYTVLWSRIHAVEMHHLSPIAYAGFMEDLRRASAAVERATHCSKLNTASLGNVVRHAHVHLFPRSAEDPQRLAHPWIHEARFGEPFPELARRRWIDALREAL